MCEKQFFHCGVANNLLWYNYMLDLDILLIKSAKYIRLSTKYSPYPTISRRATRPPDLIAISIYSSERQRDAEL